MWIRIDDIGASTKIYNQHGKKLFRWKGLPFFYFPFADLGPFKRLPPFAQWAVYNELTVAEWSSFFPLFTKYSVKPVIGVTACWIDADSRLTPFPKKFPDEAKYLKKAFRSGKITIANHGLTHCVDGKHVPTFWGNNRNYHREFWPYLSEDWHKEHILQSQKILEDYFELPITIFVPPGNVWSLKTYKALRKTSIKTVVSKNYMQDSTKPTRGISFRLDRNDFNLHDRELKLYGPAWLEKELAQRFKNIDI